jgi:hypothetical protein
MVSQKASPKTTAEHLMAKAADCFDLATAQHDIADTQHEVASRQHHSADKVDANADKLDALAQAFEAEAIAIKGQADFDNARTSAPLRGKSDGDAAD